MEARRICAAAASAALVLACPAAWARGRGEAAAPQTVLRIGTPNEVKVPNIFTDYYLGLFAHISNPPLMRMAPDGTLTGLVAESWTVSPDNTVWTFKIRDDLTWSDGKKLTAEDVRFSILYTGENYAGARWIKDTIKESRVEGERRAVFTFTRPYSTLALEFATYIILPRHVWEGVKDPARYSNPESNVGCGPFVIVKTDTAAGVVRFGRNPHWKGAQPKINGYEVQCYKNAEVLALALEKGDVDTYYAYAATYPYAGIDRLKATGRFEFVEKANLGLPLLAFNLKKAPFDDRAFREAFTYALDYAEIARLDALGYGRIATRGFVPPGMGGYAGKPALAYDPAKAKSLLAAAGYRDADGNGLLEGRDGKELNLSLLVRAEQARIAELVKDHLSRAGVRCEIRSLDLNAWVAAKDKYDYDLTIARTTPWGMLMHAGWGTGYFDSRRTGQGVLHVLEDPAFLALADGILAVTDPARRETFAAAVQDYYARELPGLALYWNMVVTPYNKAFRGWHPDPLYGIYNIETLTDVERTGS